MLGSTAYALLVFSTSRNLHSPMNKNVCLELLQCFIQNQEWECMNGPALTNCMECGSVDIQLVIVIISLSCTRALLIAHWNPLNGLLLCALDVVDWNFDSMWFSVQQMICKSIHVINYILSSLIYFLSNIQGSIIKRCVLCTFHLVYCYLVWNLLLISDKIHNKKPQKKVTWTVYH